MFDNELLHEGILKTLDGLGLDLKDENVTDTPKRVVKMYNEIFLPKEVRDEEAVKILSKTFPSKYDGMVISRGIRTYSMCIHHLLPIILDVVIGYIPSDRVLGLSKLARIADLHAHQPLIQENYSIELAESIMKTLKPKGVGVYTQGVHFCQTMRGAKQREAVMVTTDLMGCFRDDAKCRDEFLKEAHRGNF